MLRELAACGLIATFIGGVALAENVDPDDDDSQYAYAENAGWINAEPLGDGGPGVHVSDFALTGWLWAENVGWISLSCQNTASCAAVDYGVSNDGEGRLAGWAWSENAGWISFSCANTSTCAAASYGVTIHRFTGEFAGQAWSENLGWITFASSGPTPFGVRTAWACTPPSGSPSFLMEKIPGAVRLAWEALPSALYYDVASGDLGTLRLEAGDFAAATSGCVTDNESGTAVLVSATQAPGTGSWFAIRAGNCGGGTYDSAGSGQFAPRDPGINASGHDCSLE